MYHVLSDNCTKAIKNGTSQTPEGGFGTIIFAMVDEQRRRLYEPRLFH
jgi:hypothetical protein